MTRTRIDILAALALTVLCTTGCYAAKLNVGDAAPEWSALPGTDDKPHALADYKDAKLVVLVFTCNQCPVAQAYQDRIMAIQRDFGPKGVQVVAVNCNKNDENGMDAMKKRAEEMKYNFPYLFDASQKIGHDYGAKCTPHAFLLDKDRKVAYMGAIDDNLNAESAKTPYLRDAISAVLDGNTPPKTVTRPMGCGIHYE